MSTAGVVRIDIVPARVLGETARALACAGREAAVGPRVAPCFDRSSKHGGCCEKKNGGEFHDDAPIRLSVIMQRFSPKSSHWSANLSHREHSFYSGARRRSHSIASADRVMRTLGAPEAVSDK